MPTLHETPGELASDHRCTWAGPLTVVRQRQPVARAGRLEVVAPDPATDAELPGGVSVLALYHEVRAGSSRQASTSDVELE